MARAVPFISSNIPLRHHHWIIAILMIAGGAGAILRGEHWKPKPADVISLFRNGNSPSPR